MGQSRNFSDLSVGIFKAPFLVVFPYPTFSHFGGAFCRYGFQARTGGCFFADFHAFGHFLVPFWKVFWDKNMNKWSMEKQAKNESDIFMQAMRVIPRLAPCGPLKEFKNIPKWQLVPSFLP